MNKEKVFPDDDVVVKVAEDGIEKEEDEDFEEEQKVFPDSWNPSIMKNLNRLFFILPAAICSVVYLAIIICALIMPSPTWYSTTMQMLVVPCYLFIFIGSLFGILGTVFLHKKKFICRLMLNFYRLSAFYAQTISSFLSEFVGLCIGFEAAAGTMGSTYFDFDERRIEYLNHFHNAFFPAHPQLCIKVSTGLYVAMTVMLLVSNLINSCFGISRFSTPVIGDKMNARLYGYVYIFRMVFMCILMFSASDGLPPWGMFGFGNLSQIWGILFVVLAVVVLLVLAVYMVTFHVMWYRLHPFSFAVLRAELEAVPLDTDPPNTASFGEAGEAGEETNHDAGTWDDNEDDSYGVGYVSSSSGGNNSNSKNSNSEKQDLMITERERGREVKKRIPKQKDERDIQAAAADAMNNNMNVKGKKNNSNNKYNNNRKHDRPAVYTLASNKGYIKPDKSQFLSEENSDRKPFFFFLPNGASVPLEIPVFFKKKEGGEKKYKHLERLRMALNVVLFVNLGITAVTMVIALYYFVVIAIVSVMHDNRSTYKMPFMDPTKGSNINFFNIFISENVDNNGDNDNTVGVYRIADFIEIQSVREITVSAVYPILLYGFGMMSAALFWFQFLLTVAKENNTILKDFENSFREYDIRLIEEAKKLKAQWYQALEREAGIKAQAKLDKRARREEAEQQTEAEKGIELTKEEGCSSSSNNACPTSVVREEEEEHTNTATMFPDGLRIRGGGGREARSQIRIANTTQKSQGSLDPLMSGLNTPGSGVVEMEMVGDYQNDDDLPVHAGKALVYNF